MTTITAKVLDTDGYEVAAGEFETVKDAKRYVLNVLTDQWAREVETDHARLRTHKGEVYKDGVCIWDRFYSAKK